MKKAIMRISSFILSAAMLLSAPAVCAEEYISETVTLSPASLNASADDIARVKKDLTYAIDHYQNNAKINAKMDIDTINDIYNDIIKDYKYFYINGIPDYYVYSNGNVESVNFSYATSKENYLKIKDATIKKIESVLDSVDPEWTDLQKCAYIHDYIILNCSYKTDISYEQSPYGVLVKGYASCEGYSKTYQSMLTALGVECDVVISESMNHMWNIVKVDGQWYHVDVTYDDPVYMGNDFPSMSNGQAHHIYFMKSDKGLKKHEGWKAPHKANSKNYDTISWNDCITPFSIYKDNICYTTTEGKVCKYDLSRGVIATLTKVKDEWTIDLSARDYIVYTSKYSGVCYYNGALYYNTPYSIIKYDLKTKKRKIVHRLDKKGGVSTGVFVNKNGIYCYFSDAEENDSPRLVAKFN